MKHRAFQRKLLPNEVPPEPKAWQVNSSIVPELSENSMLFDLSEVVSICRVKLAPCPCKKIMYLCMILSLNLIQSDNIHPISTIINPLDLTHYSRPLIHHLIPSLSQYQPILSQYIPFISHLLTQY